MAMEKVSLTLPADLLAEARQWADGNLSAYVADGLRRRILADRQRRFLAELDEQYGALSEDEVAEALRVWRDEA